LRQQPEVRLFGGLERSDKKNGTGRSRCWE
jgi:hypothetical protein